MSLPMWTQDALCSEITLLDHKVWRLVELQSKYSTMKLVDNSKEQQLLEEMLDDSKPPVPPECRHLDYLLFTPFRYIARTSSRFRRKGQRQGVFYAACKVETAVAEVAFYRLLFFAESPKTVLPANALPFTAFSSHVKTGRAINLTTPKLLEDEDLWTKKRDYSACLELADNARSADIDCIISRSVRDPEAGLNVSLLDCRAFAVREPERGRDQTWQFFLKADGVVALRDFPEKRMEFSVASFQDERLTR